MNEFRACQRETSLDSDAELYKMFTRTVQRHLHIVFTMSPADNLTAAAGSSPALFNRCVVDWFGKRYVLEGESMKMDSTANWYFNLQMGQSGNAASGS